MVFIARLLGKFRTLIDILRPIMTINKYWIVALEFPPFPGGQATYAFEMAASLSQKGERVEVICPRYQDIVDDFDYKFDVSRIFKHQQISISAYFDLCKILMNVDECDVILCCDIRAGLLTTAMPWIKGKKVLMFHGGEILHSESSYFSKIVNKISACNKDKLVANSRYSAGLVEKHIGKKCHAIPLGVSDYWKESIGSSFDDKNLEFLRGKKILYLAARIEKRKGHIQAFEIILSSNLVEDPEFVFAFSGKNVDEEHMKKVLSYCEKYPKLFMYLGVISRNDVKEMYRISKALLLPAISEPKHIEGFGLVILEAAAQGCPCIVTSVGGIPDAVSENNSGVLFDIEDKCMAAELICRIVNDDSYQRKLSKGAKEFSALMTWNGVVEKTFRNIYGK